MAGISTFTILTKNGDPSYAGTCLFNRNRIINITTFGTGTLMTYFRNTLASPVTYDKYVLSDSFGTVSAIVGDYLADSVTLSVYKDIENTAMGTEVQEIGTASIAYGVSSGDSDSMLYIVEGNSVKKILCNSTLSSIVTSSGIGSMIIGSTFIIT